MERDLEVVRAKDPGGPATELRQPEEGAPRSRTAARPQDDGNETLNEARSRPRKKVDLGAEFCAPGQFPMKTVRQTLGSAPASLDHAIGPSGRRADGVSRRGKSSQERSRRERDATQHYLDVVDVIVLVLNTDATVKLINRRGC